MAARGRLHIGGAVSDGDPPAGGGKERADRFDVVLAGDVVDRKKPAPDIYLLALQRLGVTAGEAVVIEDSRNGSLAASAAGLRCVMTVNGYTAEEDNSEAILVVSSWVRSGVSGRV